MVDVTSCTSALKTQKRLRPRRKGMLDDRTGATPRSQIFRPGPLSRLRSPPQLGRYPRKVLAWMKVNNFRPQSLNNVAGPRPSAPDLVASVLPKSCDMMLGPTVALRLCCVACAVPVPVLVSPLVAETFIRAASLHLLRRWSTPLVPLASYRPRRLQWPPG